MRGFLKALCLVSMLLMITSSRATDFPAFQDVFEQHGSVMLLIDPATGRIADANPAAAKFYGYTRDGLRALGIQDINTLSPEQVAEERIQAEREGRNYFIFRHRTADRSIRTVEVYSHPYEIKGQRFLLSIIQDINKTGTTILLVEQNANMALSIANRAYVLETGRITLSGDAKELAASEDVRKAYLGG